MKHKVTLTGTVTVTTEQLSALAALGIPMSIEPVVDKAAPVRRRARLAAVKSTAPLPEATAVPTVAVSQPAPEPAKVKKTRAKKAAEPAGKAPEVKADHSRESVLAMFSELIDNDFDAAAGILSKMRVAKFSEITDDRLAEVADLIAAAV